MCSMVGGWQNVNPLLSCDPIVIDELDKLRQGKSLALGYQSRKRRECFYPKPSRGLGSRRTHVRLYPCKQLFPCSRVTRE